MDGYKKQLNAYYSGKENPTNSLIEFGKTPDILVKAGFSQRPLIMTYGIANKVTRLPGNGQQGHFISAKVLKQLPQHLENPAMVIKNPEKNALVAVTDLYDNKGKQIIVAIHKNHRIQFTESSRIVKVNEIRSIYGKENIENYINAQREKGNVVYEDKEKAAKLSVAHRLQLPRGTTTNSDTKILPKNAISVNSFDKNKKAAGFNLPYGLQLPEDTVATSNDTQILPQTAAPVNVSGEKNTKNIAQTAKPPPLSMAEWLNEINGHKAQAELPQKEKIDERKQAKRNHEK